MLASGVVVTALEEKKVEEGVKRSKPVYNNRKKKPAPAAAPLETEAKVIEVPQVPVSQKDEGQSWDQESDKEDVKESWDQESDKEDVKESWDQESDKEDVNQESEEGVPPPPKAKKEVKVSEVAKNATKDALVVVEANAEEEEESEEDDEESEEGSEDEDSEDDSDEDSEDITATEKLALRRKEEAAVRRQVYTFSLY